MSRKTLNPLALSRRSLILSAVAAGALGAALPALAQGADTPVHGGTLVYLEKQAHGSLYPPATGFYPSGGLFNQLADKLTYQDPATLEIQPWLATSWEVNADATEFTFQIRPGVTFSDGTPLDAEAIAVNYRLFGKGDKERGYAISEVFSNFADAEATGPLTLRVRFTAPSPSFLQGAAAVNSGIVSPATLALAPGELGDATKIIASGPFVVESEDLGREVVLVAREDYAWAPPGLANQGRAYLDRIQILTLPEDSVRIGALLSGQGDFTRQVPPYSEADVLGAGYQVYGPQTGGVNHSIHFRPDNPLLADVRVRKALLHATDRAEIVTALYSENFPLARSVLSDNAQGFVDLSDRLAFDPELSAGLLDEAGWVPGPDGIRVKDGQRLSLNVYSTDTHQQNQDFLLFLAEYWGRVGVELTITPTDASNASLAGIDPLKAPIISLAVARADPDILRVNFHPATRNRLLQLGGASKEVKSFVDPKLNALLDAITSEPVHEKRLELTRETQEYLIDQAYVIPIYQEPQVYAGAPHLRGIGFEAVARPSFYQTWLAPR